MTAEECIDKIAKVLSRDITISEDPHFHVDGSSTNIIFPGGKESLERLFEIGNIIKEYYKKEIWSTELDDYFEERYGIDIDEIICDEILKEIRDENQKDEEKLK